MESYDSSGSLDELERGDESSLGSENSEEYSEAFDDPENPVHALVGAPVRAPAMAKESPKNDFYEPHWEELIDAKNKIIEIIEEEHRVFSFKFIHKKSSQRKYGMSKPSKNELIKLLEKLLDFLERLSMARGKFPGPAYRISDYFHLLEEQVMPHFRDPWCPDKKVDCKFDALNIQKNSP